MPPFRAASRPAADDAGLVAVQQQGGVYGRKSENGEKQARAQKRGRQIKKGNHPDVASPQERRMRG